MLCHPDTPLSFCGCDSAVTVTVPSTQPAPSSPSLGTCPQPGSTRPLLPEAGGWDLETACPGAGPWERRRGPATKTVVIAMEESRRATPWTVGMTVTLTSPHTLSKQGSGPREAKELRAPGKRQARGPGFSQGLGLHSQVWKLGLLSTSYILDTLGGTGEAAV